MADDISKKILLSIELDNSELIKRSATAATALNKLKEEKKELDKQLKDPALKDNTKALDELNESIQKNLAQQRALGKEISNNNKIIDNQIKQANSADGSYDQMSAKLGELKQKYKDLSDEERTNIEIGGKLLAEINQLNDGLVEIDATQGVYVRNVGNYTNSLAGLEQQVKDIKEQLKNTEIGTDQFEDLNKTLKDTQLKMQQVQGNVDEFGNKEPKNNVKKSYDDMADAAAGAVSAVSLLSAAFGENENLQEVQTKLIGGIALAQGIQNIAKARGAVIDLIATARTKALTAAQFLYSQVVGKSTGALKVFKLALAGTGIGAIVLLLGELIFNFDGVQKAAKKLTNGINDFRDKLAGGNKAVKLLLDILFTLVAPITLTIRLFADFEGTINELQTTINGLYDWLIRLTEGIPILGDVVKFAKTQFNFMVGAVKSLTGENKKFKVDLETLTKVYENHNAEIEKNKKNIDDQIRLAQAQGASEKKLADLTRQSLTATVKSREESFNKAMEIQSKLIKQNGKLSDDQQKLFDTVTTDFQNSQLDLKVFEAEQLKQRQEKYKEFAEKRKEQIKAIVTAEMDYRTQLEKLSIEFLQTEQERQLAALAFEQQQQLKAIDESLKSLEGSEKDKEDAIAAANELKLGLTAKYNRDVEKLNDDFATKQNADQQKALEESFIGKATALTDAYDLEAELLDKSLKKQEDIEAEKLKLTLKLYQDQLALAKAFALDDSKLTQQEIDNINTISFEVDKIVQKIKDLENQPKVIEGLGLTQEDVNNINFAGEQITKILTTIGDVINADAANRIRAIDDAFKYEQAKIEQSTASQAEKEQKILELTEKAGTQKYNIELEQFRSTKALNIINTTIAGALAVVQALAQLGPVAGGIAAGVVAGVTAAQIGIIASQPEPPPPSFDTGGFTGNGFNRDQTGHKVAGVVHDNEWVAPKWMVQSPVYANHIAALEGARIRGFATGGFTGPAGVNNTLDMSNIENLLIQLLNKDSVVKVQDVTAAQAKVAKVTNNATLM